MNNKDIKLFNDALHNVKTVLFEVKNERDKHQETMTGLILQLTVVIDELNELVEDLIGDIKYCEICGKELKDDDKFERCGKHSNFKIYKKQIKEKE